MTEEAAVRGVPEVSAGGVLGDVNPLPVRQLVAHGSPEPVVEEVLRQPRDVARYGCSQHGAW